MFPTNCLRRGIYVNKKRVSWSLSGGYMFQKMVTKSVMLKRERKKLYEECMEMLCPRVFLTSAREMGH